VKSLAAVAGFHALLGWAFVTGLGFDPVAAVDERLRVFDIPEELPPPPQPEAKPPPVKETARTERVKPAPKDPEGAAAPPNLKSKPTEIVAPKREVVLEVKTPVVAAPVAGPGAQASAGAAPVRGPGTGAGGQGVGLGSGASGYGSGGGGGGTAVRRPRCIRCELPDSVLPRRLYESNLSAVVGVSFSIQPDGRVRGCRVTRSSGDRELDAITCREIERRYRYRPALDAWGEPVAFTMSGPHEWELRREPDRWYDADIPDDQ
jgi:periplasmic protein TonB